MGDLNMSSERQEDREVNEEADDIATKMIGILVSKFKEKEGRDPDGEEMEQLLGELTEERVAELLGMESGCDNAAQEVHKKYEKDSEEKDELSSTNTSSSASSTGENNTSEGPPPSKEADDIASGILKIMVEKFKEKTGHDPTEDDVSKMLDEMTEERVAELLGEGCVNDSGSSKRDIVTDQIDVESNKKLKVC